MTSILQQAAPVDQRGHAPVRTERPEPTWYSRAGKRALDLSVAIPLLVLTAPIMAAVALALRLQVGRHVVLRQQRVGRDGRPFTMIKFRTMRTCRRATARPEFAGVERRLTHKSDDDPRHTTVGRLVRKFSLDELPELVNVVRGDMSLVGPRPELDEVASDLFRHHPRHNVRPGLTGPYQVSDLRLTGRLEPGLDLDADYAERVMLRRDLALMAQTVAVVVRGTGS